MTVWYSFLWWIPLAKDCGTNLNNNISTIHKLPHSLRELLFTLIWYSPIAWWFGWCYVKSHISHSTLIVISSVTLWGLYANENSPLPTFVHCDRLWYKSLMCFRLIKITPSNLLLCLSHICRVFYHASVANAFIGTGSPCFPGAFCVALTQCKNPPATAGDIGDVGLIPGLGRSPGESHGNPLQYCCLENPHG